MEKKQLDQADTKEKKEKRKYQKNRHQEDGFIFSRDNINSLSNNIHQQRGQLQINSKIPAVPVEQPQVIKPQVIVEPVVVKPAKKVVEAAKVEPVEVVEEPITIVETPVAAIEKSEPVNVVKEKPMIKEEIDEAVYFPQVNRLQHVIKFALFGSALLCCCLAATVIYLVNNDTVEDPYNAWKPYEEKISSVCDSHNKTATVEYHHKNYSFYLYQGPTKGNIELNQYFYVVEFNAVGTSLDLRFSSGDWEAEDLLHRDGFNILNKNGTDIEGKVIDLEFTLKAGSNSTQYLTFTL